MSICKRWLVLFAGLFLILLPLTIFASGNFLDSLQETKQEGVANQDSSDASPISDEPLPAEPDAPPADEPSPQIQAQAQIDPKVIQAIQEILSKLGMLPPGAQIIIQVPSNTRPNTPPTPAPTTVPTTAPTAAPTTPASGGVTRASAETKNAIKSKYGVAPLDGDTFWSQGQAEVLEQTLARLPAGFRTATTEVVREKDISPALAPGMQGRVYGFVDSRNPLRVHMLDLSARGRSVQEAKSQFQGTLVHEMTHCFQNKNPAVANAFRQQFWGGGRPKPPGSVSPYGNTQWVEDMAESVRSYFQAGQRMKQSNPERYEFIRKNIMEGKEY